VAAHGRHRELQVLRLLGVGKSNQEIADELVVVVDTVKKHVATSWTSWGAANRAQAVARARVLGLLR
jgi:ATP/maltotriose-dependent transcriptional regulator MalT